MPMRFGRWRDTQGIPVIGIAGSSWWQLVRFGFAAPLLTLLEEEGITAAFEWLTDNCLEVWLIE
jgi:hypothetical protein